MNQNKQQSFRENENIDRIEQNLVGKSKNILKIILLLIVVVVLVFVASYFFNKRNQENTESKEIQARKDSLPVEVLDDLTVEQLDVLNEPTKKIVLESKKEHCEKIENEKMKENCLEMIKLSQAIFLEDEILCEQLDTQRDNCLSNIAFNKDDIDICEKISDQRRKQACFDEIYIQRASGLNSIELCDRVEEEFKQKMCIEDVLSFQQDIEFCNSEYIVGNNMVNKCESIILLNRATLLNDFDMCEQIPLEEYKEECLQSIGE